jgi:hypothetical protein
MNTPLARGRLRRLRTCLQALYTSRVYLEAVNCLCTVWCTPLAWSRSNPLTTCIEDGGQAGCTSPDSGSFIYNLGQPICGQTYRQLQQWSELMVPGRTLDVSGAARIRGRRS